VPKLLELLLERATDYGKTSLELVKLKTIDKTTEIVSSLIPLSVAGFAYCIFSPFSESGISFMVGGSPWKNILWILCIAGILCSCCNCYSFLA